MLNLVKSLELDLIVEGVEDAATVDWLASSKAGMQVFYFARPMSIRQATKMLAS